MPASRKRTREIADGVLAVNMSAVALRAALTDRSSANAAPAAWRAAAAAAGVAGADAFLCHLGRSIVSSLQTVSVAAETSRAELRSTRAALHSAVDSRCDELDARIATAESTKIAALERELCAIDAALERWRSAQGAAALTAASSDDAELLAKHAELTARLDAAEEQLHALPTASTEPLHISLELGAPALLAVIARFGRVIAPLAITAADLAITAAPHHVCPGSNLTLQLVLQGLRHATQSAAELEVSLGAAAASTHAVVLMGSPGEVPQPLSSDIRVDVSARCVRVSFAVPSNSLAELSTCSVLLSVRGLSVASFSGIPVKHGLATPLQLQYCNRGIYINSLCVSLTGWLFAPQYGSPEVLVFDAAGAPLPSISVAALGFNKNELRWAAFAEAPSPTLLLADYCIGLTRLFAVDPVTCAVRWATAPGELETCSGLAVLPTQGIVIFASMSMLFAHRLSDGVRVGFLESPDLDSSLTAEPTTGTLFGNIITTEESSNAVFRASWTLASGFEVDEDACLPEAGVSASMRIMAVVPPVPGKRVSHLVVGATETPELMVLALPSLALVHTHKLDSMEVIGLAADPWGSALAVSDKKTVAIHVLAWPLPGMPVLE